MGIDEVGINKVGIDKVGITRSVVRDIGYEKTTKLGHMK